MVVFFDLGDHLALLLEELVLLVVKLLGLLDDLVLLVGETVVDLALLSLLLQKPHRLEGALALDDERAHLVEVLVGQLLALWLGGLLLDEGEQSLDLALLIDVHL